jgi:hypothetical protein
MGDSKQTDEEDSFEQLRGDQKKSYESDIKVKKRSAPDDDVAKFFLLLSSFSYSFLSTSLLSLSL